MGNISVETFQPCLRWRRRRPSSRFCEAQLRGLNLILGWCYLLYSFRVNLVLLDFKHHRLEMDLLLISGPIIFFANRRSLILSQLRFWCEEDH